jgi:adenine C2-methylase RlmN of 23S rRNA A2503 and tRNA A37
MYEGSSPETIERFKPVLERARFPRPSGRHAVANIEAACGPLVTSPSAGS